jgi:hypothetical protein
MATLLLRPSGLWEKVAPVEKPCLECGEPVIKKKNESKARFEKRKFCSPECSHKYLKDHKIGWWKRGDE